MSIFVFYSERCEKSQELRNIIRDESLDDKCKFICLETERDKFCDFVKCVPTIIAKNLSKPLFGDDAIEWIKNLKYYNRCTNNIKKNNVVEIKIRSAFKDLEFNKSEAEAISDQYSVFYDKNKDKNINDDDNDEIIDDADISKPMLDYNKISIDAPITKDLTNRKISDVKLSDDAQDMELKKRILLRRNQIMLKRTGASKIN